MPRLRIFRDIWDFSRNLTEISGNLWKFLVLSVIYAEDVPDPSPALQESSAYVDLPLDTPDEMPPWRRSDAIRRWHPGFTSSEIIQIVDSHLLAPETPRYKTSIAIGDFLVVQRRDGYSGDFRLHTATLHLPPDFAHITAPWKVYYLLHPASIVNETHRLVDLINQKWSHSGALVDDIRAAAKFGLVFEAIQPYPQGNKRVVRAVIADMLYDRLGFALAMPQSEDPRTSHGTFHWMFTVAKSVELRPVLEFWGNNPPRSLPPVLNSSLYAAFLLDCILDQVLAFDIDAPSAAVAAAAY